MGLFIVYVASYMCLVSVSKQHKRQFIHGMQTVL